MSRATFDSLIHAPIRLRICAMLVPLQEAEFKILREELGVSDSVLSKHLSSLSDAGYLKLRKGALGGRQRTWIRITTKGRRAFSAHVAALQEIASMAEG